MAGFTNTTPTNKNNTDDSLIDHFSSFRRKLSISCTSNELETCSKAAMVIVVQNMLREIGTLKGEMKMLKLELEAMKQEQQKNQAEKNHPARRDQLFEGYIHQYINPPSPKLSRGEQSTSSTTTEHYLVAKTTALSWDSRSSFYSQDTEVAVGSLPKAQSGLYEYGANKEAVPLFDEHLPAGPTTRF
ncbi:MAG: hypothetical protein M1834_009124 [Cirrosporium novae-zelandiae]|nr:MAG: hypothetical protein M1834_009124 [Cirrosporium novae-zelandiae]